MAQLFPWYIKSLLGFYGMFIVFNFVLKNNKLDNNYEKYGLLIIAALFGFTLGVLELIKGMALHNIHTVQSYFTYERNIHSAVWYIFVLGFSLFQFGIYTSYKISSLGKKDNLKRYKNILIPSLIVLAVTIYKLICFPW